MFPTPESILQTPRLSFLANYYSQTAELVDPTNSKVIEAFINNNLSNKDPNDGVESIYGFVSSLEYVIDEGSDYWQRPDETLLIRQGDCEDLSILMSSFFELNGLFNNYFVLTFNVDWQEYHVANLVYIPQTIYGSERWLYLDASYPHVIGGMPFYVLDAKVFGFYSKANQYSNPLLVSFPQPLNVFVENAGINQFINMQ